jgi:hypothetical protein
MVGSNDFALYHGEHGIAAAKAEKAYLKKGPKEFEEKHGRFLFGI